MKRAIGIFVLSLVLGTPVLVQAHHRWHAWGVHGGYFDLVADSNLISAFAGTHPQYHWDIAPWAAQTGQVAYVSTRDFNGQTIENALTSINYDVIGGSWTNVRFNIIVEDGGGRKAIIAPAANSAISAGFNVGAVANDFSVLDAEPGWTGTGSTGVGAANWNDIKNLTIANGPAPVLPDTLNGDATGLGDAVYMAQNWEDWAYESGAPEAQRDGFLIAFGQTTGGSPANTIIDNLEINGDIIVVAYTPDCSTYMPMQVTETSALFQGGVVDDGGAPCSFRYHYWRLGHEDDKKQTEWDCCYWDHDILGARVMDLLPGTTYVYSLEVDNGFDVCLNWWDKREFTTLGDPPPDIDKELVAHYIFSGNALDVSGNDNHGIPIGDPNYLMDMIGGTPQSAIGLDGIVDTVQLPRSIGESWTIALWMRTDDPGRDGLGGTGRFWNGFGIVNGEVPGFADDFGLAFQSHALSYGVGSTTGPGTTIVANSAILDTEWHHIAAVRDASNGFLALYLDGQQAMNTEPDPNNPLNFIQVPVQGYGPVGPKEAPASLFAGAINFEFGKFLFGELADLRLYNYVLDANEIAGLGGLLSVKPMEGLIAVSDPGLGLPLTAVVLDSIPASALTLGVTTFSGPPLWPQFPADQADDFDLDSPASADAQLYLKTMFGVPVSTVFLLERGANDSGNVQALDIAGNPIGNKVPFGPTDFLDTGYPFLTQTGGGLRIDSGSPIYGIVIYPPDSGLLGVDPVSISGVPALP